MKILISKRKELLENLSKIQGVVEKRNTLQILTNIYLQVSDEMLTIKATDLEISMETSFPVKVQSEGNVTVSAKSFIDIVKELPDEEIQIHSKENHWMNISCGNSKFNIMGMAPEDYPALPNFSQNKFVDLDCDKLKRMIDHTILSVSTDETRYHMNGVFLEPVKNNKYRMVGCDGHRLAYFEDSLFSENSNFLERGIIIPKKGIQELRKLLDSDAEQSKMALEGNHLILKRDQSLLFIRLIEGRFPDYKQVIPAKNPNKVEVDRAEFISSLKRVSLLANEKSRAIKLSINEGRLELSTNNPDIGEAKEILNTPFTGESLEIGFNAKYLMDSMSALDSDKIMLHLNDRMSPGIVDMPNDERFLSVLMPMRI